MTKAGGAAAARRSPPGRRGGRAPRPGPAAQPVPEPREALVVEGWVTLKADSVGKTAAAIRAHVDAAGGRVVAEDLSGGPIDAAYGTMQLRLPPAEAQAFLDWIEKQGEIEARRIGHRRVQDA